MVAQSQWEFLKRRITQTVFEPWASDELFNSSATVPPDVYMGDQYHGMGMIRARCNANYGRYLKREILRAKRPE